MVKRYCNKGYINDIVSRVYGFIGEKELTLEQISEIYANQVSLQINEEDISLACRDFTVWFSGERISLNERFALSLVELFGGSQNKTNSELISFFNSLSL